MKKLSLNYKKTENETKKLINTFAKKDHYDTVINESCNAYDLQGNEIFCFRKKFIPSEILESSYQNLKNAASKSTNRGAASGGDTKYGKDKHGRTTKVHQTFVKGTDEMLSVESGIVGYFDRSGHYDFCRTTAFNKKHINKFKAAMPLIEFVDNSFKEIVPKRHAKQLSMVKATDPNYRIGETAFSTVTVNKNYRTAYHTDAGDFRPGFGNLVAYCKDIEPVLFVLPRFGVAIQVETDDLLLVDVHEIHGNTEIIKKNDNGIRLSYVMYYRENMWRCLPPSEELKRTKLNQRVVGQKFIEGLI